MALSPTPLAPGTPESVALTDFNNAVALLNAAFPLIAANIATDAVETAKINALAVTAAKLAANAVETAKIKNANVTLAKLANIAAFSIIGNNTEDPATPIELTTTEVKTLLGGYVFVPRYITGPDFTVANFTCDGVLHVNGLDLSAFLPPATKAVSLVIHFKDATLGRTFNIYTNQGAALNNAVYGIIKSINRAEVCQFTIPIDPDRLLDYKVTNDVIDQLDVYVLGYFL